MAIQITKNLSVTRNPTGLPATLSFRQTLRSSKTSERVTVEYSINKSNDVWFQDADGGLTKTITRVSTVRSANTPILHRAKARRGPGQPVASVTIRQEITDENGKTTRDRDRLVLLP